MNIKEVQGDEISPEHRGTSEDRRVWMWQGEEYRLAPKVMILNTILRRYAATTGDKKLRIM
jgi:hypothetical protein